MRQIKQKENIPSKGTSGKKGKEIGKKNSNKLTHNAPLVECLGVCVFPIMYYYDSTLLTG